MCKSSEGGKALSRILCSQMINNPMGLNAAHVAGVENILADRVSDPAILSTLSPESQASLADLASFVVKTRSGPNQTAAEGTFRSRQGHFLKFCDKHKITDPVMAKADQDDRNYVLACYASSLIHGETILARTIKTDTIKRYLYAAASFSLARQCVDPRLNFFGKESHHLSKILGAHKHWEAMPDRRELYSLLLYYNYLYSST
eukprot:scaffold70121_cov55-Attheya_sp.AAC.3